MLIIQHIENQAGQTISDRTLRNIRQRFKRESFEWYSKLREGQYEYIHEFRQRINEIIDLQRSHHKIIQDNEHNPSIQQTSLAELHKLNITLSNYFDIAPYIIPKLGADLKYSTPLSAVQQDKKIIV